MGKPINDLNFWKKRIDSAPKEYHSVYITSEKDWERIFEAHKKIISEHIKPTESVLDAGCGYGRMAPLFSDYRGVDFSPDFIERARDKFPENNFYVADLKALAFQDDSFDWAICVSIKTMVIANLGEEEWNKMLKELKRVAKKVLVLEYEDPEPYEIL